MIDYLASWICGSGGEGSIEHHVANLVEGFACRTRQLPVDSPSPVLQLLESLCTLSTKALESCPNADRLEMTLAIPDLRHDTKQLSGKQHRISTAQGSESHVYCLFHGRYSPFLLLQRVAINSWIPTVKIEPDGLHYRNDH